MKNILATILLFTACAHSPAVRFVDHSDELPLAVPAWVCVKDGDTRGLQCVSMETFMMMQAKARIDREAHAPTEM